MSAHPRLPSSPRGQSPPAPRRPAPWIWAAASSGLAAALIVLVSAGWQPLLRLDVRTAHALHASAGDHPAVTAAARVLTDWVWDTVTMRVLVAVVCVVLWRRGDGARAFLLALTMLAGVLVQQGLKAVIGRERPEWEEPLDAAHYAAMPSGHAMTAALACGLLTWLAWDRWAHPAARGVVVAGAAVSVAGVSLTRIYLGVHWLTDVVAGVALGVGMAALAAGSWQWWRTPGRIAP